MLKSKSNVFCEYTQKIQEKLVHGTLELYKVTDFRPEWDKNLFGIVYEDSETLKKGDKVYWHYMVSEDEQNIFEHEGKTLIRVPLDKVFCYVRDGQLFAHRDYVLSLPVYDDNIEEVEIEGKKAVVKMSESGLVISTDVSHKKNWSKIHFIGENDLELSKDDLVFMRKNNHHKYEIEQTWYHIFEQDQILAKITA